jgi:adenylyltransferase/sulfurtransferase
MNPKERERYARHILLREVGGQGQQKLLAARVLVVGAGGLGSPILSYLAAAGVGTIGVADSDVVSLSNLQRQTLFRTEDVGREKTEATKAALARLTPHVTVHTHPRIFDDNAREIIGGYDLIVEGVDNFETRYALNRACIVEKKPLVSAAVGRFEGQLSTFKPYQKPGVLPCYRCLVPEEPPREEQVNCAEEGVLGAVTGVMGTLAAMEVLGASVRTIALPADPACADCGAQTPSES